MSVIIALLCVLSVVVVLPALIIAGRDDEDRR